MEYINIESASRVPKRILSQLMSSLSAGVVPRAGAPYIAIGRTDEIAALTSDLARVAEGEGAMRFLIGRYGSGKSFLIQLMRGYALERGFITADCDLSTERRLCGTSGSGLATYRELLRNLATKSSPDGGALSQLLARWISEIKSSVAASGVQPGTPSFDSAVKKRIYDTVRALEDGVGGFDFALVLASYYEACEAEDEDKKSACLRWLRGEYSTKTEAKAALRTGSIINDDNWYDEIKLLARLAVSIGYSGLVVFIDECVNLYKIPNRISRENNYEKILSMYNDTLEGRAEHLMLIFGGTPQFLEDRRRGLFSYEALRGRLSDGRFDSGEYKNMIGPVIRLRRLSDNELLALVLRVTALHARYYNWEPRLSDGDPEAFVRACLELAGANIMVTPREIIRDYISILNILYQNPDAKFADIVKTSLTLTPAEDAGEAGGETAGNVGAGGGTAVDADVSASEKKPASAFDPNDIII